MRIVCAGLVLLGLSGCAMGPIGAIYTDVQGPISATSNGGANARGEACATSILGLVATGDASIDAAKRAAGVAKVSAVDSSTMSILGIYGKYCTIVHGTKRGRAAVSSGGSAPKAGASGSSNGGSSGGTEDTGSGGGGGEDL